MRWNHSRDQRGDWLKWLGTTMQDSILGSPQPGSVRWASTVPEVNAIEQDPPTLPTFTLVSDRVRPGRPLAVLGPCPCVILHVNVSLHGVLA